MHLDDRRNEFEEELEREIGEEIFPEDIIKDDKLMGILLDIGKRVNSIQVNRPKFNHVASFTIKALHYFFNALSPEYFLFFFFFFRPLPSPPLVSFVFPSSLSFLPSLSSSLVPPWYSEFLELFPLPVLSLPLCPYPLPPLPSLSSSFPFLFPRIHPLFSLHCS